MIGSTLAHYRITAKLGEGGMGEVYRATDMRLDREVAIKVLPQAFTADPERLARFEREAKLLAQLHHSNIASIFGLEEASGVRALVMELVEGPTLAERLEQGSLPIADCLSIAWQLAQALEEAHERGIVHRDLKPQNIKASLDGKVKVLDFGLAKAMDPAGTGAAMGMGSESQLAMSPTLTLGGTQIGVILGTAGYMAPEQAKGMLVDKRADIWAFGVVLYEALVGGRLFAGDSVPETLAGVIKSEIDFDLLPVETPPPLRRLLRRCLERDPKGRLRDIGEARLLLGELVAGTADEPPAPASPVPAAAAPRRVPTLAVAVTAATVFALVTLGVGFRWGRARGATAPSASRSEHRFVIAAEGRTPEDRQAISPDGERIVYTAAGGLWLRDLAEVAPRRLSHADGAVEPFWSPDSREIGFARDGSLWRIGLETGAPKRICELPVGTFEGGSWGEDGRVIFGLATGGWTGTLQSCPAAGGTATTFFAPEGVGPRAARPQVLPGGAGVLYSIHLLNNKGGLAILAGGESRTILESERQPTGAALARDGRLYYSLERGVDSELWSVALDAERRKPAGEPILLAEGGELPTVSNGGALLYGAVESPPWRLALVDRRGEAAALGDPFLQNARDLVFQLAPDGRRASLILMGENFRVGELWIAELERGARQRRPLDFEPYSAVWSPDGRELLVAGKEKVLFLPAAGAGAPREIVSETTLLQPRYAPDGRWIVGYRIDPASGRDLWRVAADGGAPHEALLREPGQQANPDVSPDGRFLAYQSDESGRPEIYVRSYPTGERKWQVSTAGGHSPCWNRRGGELVWTVGNDLWSAAVASAGADFEVGAPRRLLNGASLGLELAAGRIFYNRTYDLAPDGEHFLVAQRTTPGRNEVVYVDPAITSSGKR